MAGIHIGDVELAIKHWRRRQPVANGISGCPQLQALTEVHERLTRTREAECDEACMPPAAMQAWLDWYATTPDAPCIAICSTSQGDAICKGCGRSFDEVGQWTAMSPGAKRAVWRRITAEGSAWRFNRYAERAHGGA